MVDSRDIAKFEAALLSLDRLELKKMLTSGEHEEVQPVLRIERLMIPALEHIGEEWDSGRLSLSQLYMSGRLCEELVDSMLLKSGGLRGNQPKLALTTLADHHLLGKRMVYATLRASGFEVIDYGRTEVDSLVERASGEGIDILLISTLMLPSALLVAEVRRGLDRVGCPAKIVVGGAPFRFDEELWKEVGADAMCKNASSVVGAITKLTGGKL